MYESIVVESLLGEVSRLVRDQLIHKTTKIRANLDQEGHVSREVVILGVRQK